MIQLISKIEFEQVTPFKGVARNNTFTINFANDIDIKSNWKDLTDTCVIKIPRKLYFTSKKGGKFSLDERDVYATTAQSPVFLRGDIVRVYLGYVYPSEKGFTKEINLEFEGYVVKVNPGTPVEIFCEDATWLLKQIAAPNKVFSGNTYNVGTIVKELIGNKLGANFIVRDSAETKFGGTFITQNVTVLQALQDLKKDAYIFPYIRRITNKDGSFRNELRVSSIVYYPEDLKDIYNGKERDRKWVFKFQNNIISDDIQYTRTDDINIRVQAKSYYEQVTGGKTVLKEISVFLPEISSEDSEKRTLIVYGISDTKKLKTFAQANLNRILYEGYRGTITVFGLPSVRFGDLITIVDDKFPERNGGYLCKSVEKSFGTSGFKQVIGLDMKLYDLDNKGNYKDLDKITSTFNTTGL